MAQVTDGDPGDVVLDGGVGSPHRGALWTCPGRQNGSAGRRTLTPSAVDVLRKPVPVAGPGVVSVLYGPVKMFSFFYRRISIRSEEVYSPLRGFGAFTTRCPLQSGIPPYNESLRFA